MSTESKLAQHINDALSCARCPKMAGPVVMPRPVAAKVYLCGQAPGPHEGEIGHPFAWTAGKTLFRWFSEIGVNEEMFRSRAYIGAVCRCFPGKTKHGGDRVPSREEVAECSVWMEREIALLKPEVIVAVGRLAIEQFLPPAPLTELIGKQFRITKFGHTCDLIPLPHPSGASPWFKIEPGKSLLNKALKLLEEHPAWRRLVADGC